MRSYGTENGFTGAPVWEIAQDSVGFLWIGTQGGLFRFDGTEFRRWAPDSISRPVTALAVSPDGRLAAREDGGRVFEVTPTGARAISGDLPRWMLKSLVWDDRGVLWYIAEDGVYRRRGEDSWEAIPAAAFGGENLRSLKANRVAAVDVLTDRSVWRIARDGTPRRLIADVDPWDIVSVADGRSFVLAHRRVIELSPAGRLEQSHVLGTVGRRIGLVERRGTLWAAFDRALIRFRPGEPLDSIMPVGDMTVGGIPFVDREGSLWLASNLIHQFPEPETRLWSRVDTTFLDNARFVERSDSTLWLSTWRGLFRGERGDSGREFHRVSGTLARLCTDSTGAVWSFAASPSSAILEMRGRVVVRHRFEGGSSMPHCAADRSGGAWLGFRSSIVHVSAEPRAIRTVVPPGTDEDPPRSILLHDRRDRLWVAIDPDRICSAPVPQLLDAAGVDPWTCDDIGDVHSVRGMVELPSGTLWAGTHSAGMFARDTDQWRPMRLDSLPTRTVLSLNSSPHGGAWMAGHGFLQRVEEGTAGEPVVVERLTEWHGVAGPAAGDVHEQDDGVLWVASDRGLTHVPADVRTAEFPPPPVALVEATIDGQPMAATEPLELPHDRNRLELRFAALSFRNRSQLRHQVRLGPREPWSESHGSPTFRWVDLRPGAYEIEYRASLDGVRWSPEPARFAFTVQPPWYATPWSIVLLVLVAAVVAWTVHRARLTHALALERQRTRIAMDLHDEVGSGLASVGILSGVLADDTLDRGERRRVAGDIASAAEELGHALSDIVWSLDPHTATLDELASRLTEHGERMCADADVELATLFPAAWPDERVDVAVRRNVLLVGLEALHNAARHAHAGTIQLSMLPHGSEWQLRVRDDGTGFEAPRSGYNGRRGHGLRSMQRRADEIGGVLEIGGAPGAGTSVLLRFSLRPPAAQRVRRYALRLRSSARKGD